MGFLRTGVIVSPKRYGFPQREREYVYKYIGMYLYTVVRSSVLSTPYDYRRLVYHHLDVKK